MFPSSNPERMAAMACGTGHSLGNVRHRVMSAVSHGTKTPGRHRWKPDGSYDRYFKFRSQTPLQSVAAAGYNRLVVVGSSPAGSASSAVLRCFSDGSLDASFAMKDLPHSVQALGVVDDRIYAAGQFPLPGGTASQFHYSLARYYNQVYDFALPSVDRAAREASLRFYGPPGTHYQFDASADLISWSLLGDQTMPEDGVISLSERPPAGSGARFYRARAVD